MSVAVPPTPVSATLPKPALTKGTYKGSGGILGSPAQKGGGGRRKGALKVPCPQARPREQLEIPKC